MNVKVSILIPVYNREDLISECIQSALNQTFRNFEVIVVDNKSEDSTFEICQGFATRDDRVKVYQNETNIGPVRNWQACAEKASGEFCKILFSDDTLLDTCLEKMVPRLENADVAFAFCATRVGETLEQSNVRYDLGTEKDISPNRYLTLVLRGKVPCSPGAVLLRTADLRRNLKTDFPTATPQPFGRHGAGPDVMIMLLTALNYPRIAYIRDCLVFFRAHPGSFSVANARGQIQTGYETAFCFFLRKNVGYLRWIKYSSLTWLRSIKREKKLVGLKSFLLAREGTGRGSECALAVIVSIYVIIEHSFLRIIEEMNRYLKQSLT